MRQTHLKSHLALALCLIAGILAAFTTASLCAWVGNTQKQAAVKAGSFASPVSDEETVSLKSFTLAVSAAKTLTPPQTLEEMRGEFIGSGGAIFTNFVSIKNSLSVTSYPDVTFSAEGVSSARISMAAYDAVAGVLTSFGFGSLTLENLASHRIPLTLAANASVSLQLYFFADAPVTNIKVVVAASPPKGRITGTGTAADPYLARDGEGFLKFTAAHFAAGKYSVIKNDIDITGGSFSLPAVNGTFDGRGFKLSGLTAPVFTSVSGTVKDLKAEAEIDTSASGTGIITKANSGTVSGCETYGTLTAAASRAGGVAGINSGTVTDCVNYASVSGRFESGGIAGYNTGSVLKSGNQGKVSSSFAAESSATGSHSYSMGGIAGLNVKTVDQCYNRGTVSGYTGVGAIAGTNGTATSAITDKKIFYIHLPEAYVNDATRTVKLYTWSAAANNGWPGKPMTKVNERWYKYEATASSPIYESIIVTNKAATDSGGLQTDDFVTGVSQTAKGEYWYYITTGGTKGYKVNKLPVTTAAAPMPVPALGLRSENTGKITHCYNTASVSISSGGKGNALIGDNYSWAEGGAVKYSYNTVGRLIDYNAYGRFECRYDNGTAANYIVNNYALIMKNCFFGTVSPLTPLRYHVNYALTSTDASSAELIGLTVRKTSETAYFNLTNLGGATFFKAGSGTVPFKLAFEP